MPKSIPDLHLLDDVVAKRVLDAMRTASRALTAIGVRHALAGGLAVGAYGHPRATRDVNFLVGDEAFEHHAGGLVTLKHGVPIEVGGVVVDLLSAKSDETFLAAELPTPDSARIAVVSAGALVYLKLKSPRLQDRADLVELIKAGLDSIATEAYLSKHARELVAKLHEAIAAARAEE